MELWRSQPKNRMTAVRIINFHKYSNPKSTFNIGERGKNSGDVKRLWVGLIAPWSSLSSETKQWERHYSNSQLDQGPDSSRCKLPAPRRPLWWPSHYCQAHSSEQASHTDSEVFRPGTAHAEILPQSNLHLSLFDSRHTRREEEDLRVSLYCRLFFFF